MKKEKKDKIIIQSLLLVLRIIRIMLHPSFWLFLGLTIGNWLFFNFNEGASLSELLPKIAGYSIIYMIVFEFLFRKRFQKYYDNCSKDLKSLLAEVKNSKLKG